MAFILYLEMIDTSKKQKTVYSKLSFIDLAGSENSKGLDDHRNELNLEYAKKGYSKDKIDRIMFQRSREMGDINKSLMALSQVI